MTPQRTCIGCRRVAPAEVGCRRLAPAEELIRVVRTGDGSLAVGPTLPGRGAWLCRSSASCFDAATRRGAFARALRAPVTAADVESVRDGVLGRVDARQPQRRS